MTRTEINHKTPNWNKLILRYDGTGQVNMFDGSVASVKWAQVDDTSAVIEINEEDKTRDT